MMKFYKNKSITCGANVWLRLLDKLSKFCILSPAWPIFFPRIDDSHCDRIHFSLTAVRCFDNDYVGKKPVASKEYCAEYWLREFRKAWIGALATAI